MGMDLDELDSFNNRSNGCPNEESLSSIAGADSLDNNGETNKSHVYSSFVNSPQSNANAASTSAPGKETDCLHCIERMQNVQSTATAASNGASKPSLMTSALQSLTNLWGSSASARKSPDYVKEKARDLAASTLQYVLHGLPEDSLDSVTRTMVTNVKEILVQHEIMFSGMVYRLKITPSTAHDTFVGVANQMLEGDEITWARIVTLYAFAGRLAQYCVECNMPTLAEDVTLYLANYASDRIAPFVCQNGGWDELCVQFPTNQSSSDLAKKVLLLTGLGLGLAATIMALNR